MTAPRKLTLDDLWTFKEMGNIALAPDGSRVAFVMQSTDKTKNEHQSAIYLLQLDEQGHAAGEPRQLTSGVKKDTNPVWAPDSRRLLFLSDREEEKNQLWLIDTDGGEARKLTNMQHGVNDAAWSPDGQWIAFTAMAALTDDEEVLTGRKPLEDSEKKKREEEERIRLRSTTRVWYRVDGRGFFEKFSQLFVIPAPTSGDSQVDPATIRRLTSDDVDRNQPCWTPDSREISVLCNLADDRDRSFVEDLWVIDRETGNARCITNGKLQIASYAWSPDGNHVMLVASQDLRIEGGCDTRLWLVSREGGEIQTLTAEIDNPVFTEASGDFGWPGPYRPQWSPDGRRIYFLLTEHGCVNVYRMDMVQKAITPLSVGEHLTYFLALLPGERGLLLAQEFPLHPWELHLLPLTETGGLSILAGESSVGAGGEEGRSGGLVPALGTHAAPSVTLKDGDPTGAGELVRLTSLYDRQMGEFTWSQPERMKYRGSNGDEIDAWLMRPVGAREGVRYPLLVDIHGGPQWAFGVGMQGRFQYFAAQGFAIFYCNPHGSTGSGQAFMREVEGDWGGWDFQDIMRGVDECVARGVADPERMVVTGYSYGGYMSMFVIGQTERFKAAVPMAGVSNLASFVGCSDIGFWQVLQARGYPWDPQRQDYYRQRSPLTHAARVTTPTLFLHPENDLRCPIEQSEQFYMTLKMMGKVPVEFVRAPAAWHVGTTKPSQWFAYWEKALEWFRKYVEIRAEEYE